MRQEEHGHTDDGDGGIGVERQVGLAGLGEGGKDEPKQALRRQSGNVFDEGDGIERVGALGVRAHLSNNPLAGWCRAGAKGKKEGGWGHKSQFTYRREGRSKT